ncbi:MAG: SigB/SigF/SigG family RNA polymerase sigma factor [Actinobacteria bacterium]|nr:MAG: SigB/SigF/SigG family RNA polymerase sigma factor [Actinomycetota bacterium]
MANINVPDKKLVFELFKKYKGTNDIQIRDRLVKLHLYLVEFLARRFRNRGESLEDLVQVGTIGLIKAIDRFDLGRKVEFTTYATPTIVGTLKRHFRDQKWAIRVPRRLQELNLQVNDAVSRLTQSLKRAPSIAEIADEVKASEEEILEAMDTSKAYTLISLDSERSDENDEDFTLLDFIGQEDKQLTNLNELASLTNAVKGLAGQEKKLLYLRFIKGLTQTEIAEILGISQMHVSRLLRKTLNSMRKKMIEEERIDEQK